MSKVLVEKRWVPAEIRDIRNGDRVRATSPQTGDVAEFTAEYVGEGYVESVHNYFHKNSFTFEKEVPGVKPGIYVYDSGDGMGNVVMVKPDGYTLVLPNVKGGMIREADYMVIRDLERDYDGLVYLGDHNGPAKGEYVGVNSD